MGIFEVAMFGISGFARLVVLELNANFGDFSGGI